MRYLLFFIQLLDKSGAANLFDDARVPKIFFAELGGAGVIEGGQFQVEPDRLWTGAEVLLETARGFVVKIAHGSEIEALEISLQNFQARILVLRHVVNAFHVAFEEVDYHGAVLFEQSRGSVDPSARSCHVELLEDFQSLVAGDEIQRWEKHRSLDDSCL